MSEEIRQDLLARMAAARDAMESCFNSFDATDAVQVGVTDKWSVRDLCAHMIGWQEEFLKQADSLAGPGAKPIQYNVDGFNEESVHARARQPWEQVRDAWKITIGNIAHNVESAPAGALVMGQLYRGFLEGIAITHMYEHLGQVSSWMHKLGMEPTE